jgi:hypothetical protein
LPNDNDRLAKWRRWSYAKTSRRENLPMPLLTDPWFYAVAIPAVILVGLSKGGFAGGVGFVGVPLMALTMSPVQAAAILLPILCLMDIVSVWTWWGVYDRRTLRDILPGAVLGVGLGWLLAAMVTVEMVRLIVGAVAFVFVGRWLYTQLRHGSGHASQPNTIAAGFWASYQASPASSRMWAAHPSRSMRCPSGSIQKSCRARRQSFSPSRTPSS